MNFLTEYKDEVGSLCLSAEFKENLKKACISEAAKAAGGSEEKPRIEVSEGGASSNKEVLSKMKLYKYISIAACLVAVVSSIGVVSLMSSRLKSTSDSGIYQSDNIYPESADADGEELMADNEAAVDDEYDLNEPMVASNGINPMMDDPVESSDDSMDVDMPVDDSVDEETTNVSDDEDESEDGATGYSITMNSPDYDGDYNTEDYVLMLNPSAYVDTATLFDDVGELENAVPVESPAEPEPQESESAAAREPSGSSTAYNFYDLLSGRLKQAAESGGASLVRMRIEGTADDGSSPAPYASASYTPYTVSIEYDYLNQTGCDVKACVWIKGTEENQVKGMPIYEDGDTILTSLYVNENGSVTVIDELLYDVYNMNDQDIAYHRYYERINPGYTDMGILDQERSFVTTTENNPVEYVHKAVTKELSRYIRRKIVGENYAFADLEWLGKASVGEAEPWHEPEPEAQPDDSQNPDESQEPEGGEDVPEREPIKKARVRTTDEKMIIKFAGEQVKLFDEASCEYIESTFKNSASSTNSTDYYSTAMFVGGRLAFKSTEVFKGGLTEIEITSVGCPLDLSFNGVSVGDSLESAVKTLGIKDPLDPNCTLTYKGTTITATMTFEYGTLAKIVIK